MTRLITLLSEKHKSNNPITVVLVLQKKPQTRPKKIAPHDVIELLRITWAMECNPPNCTQTVSMCL